MPPPMGLPFYEQTVTLTAPQQFEALVADANQGDTLSIRWVANYPPISNATVLLFNMDSGDRGPDLTATFKLSMVDCGMFMHGADPNLVVIVSDRGFLDASVDPAGHSSVPYNWTDPAKTPDHQSHLISTMTGWKIAGCPSN